MSSPNRAPLAHRPVRVWYQSFTDPEAHAPYQERLQAFLDTVAGPGIEYDVYGLNPADLYLSRLSEFRCAAQVISNAVRAEREGYDAVLLGHYQDAGLHEARTAVDIPVIGLGEASMLHACTLAGRIGLITIDPVYVSWHRQQIRTYGLEHRVVGVAAMQMAPEDAVRAFEQRDLYESVRERFVAAARPLIVRDEVELLMSAGGLFALLASTYGGFAIDGVPVVNPTLLAVKQAEAAIAVAAAEGVGPSRVGTFAKAPDGAVEELLDLTAAPVAPASNERTT